MKQQIQIEDKVVFLVGYSLHRGVCKRVNKKTYTVFDEVSEIDRRILKHRISKHDDLFSVIWETDKGPIGAYRISHDEFPQYNSPASHWQHSWDYVWITDGKLVNSPD